jgi:AraC-like DNA-binding protein
MKHAQLHCSTTSIPAVLSPAPREAGTGSRVLTGAFGTILFQQVTSGCFTFRHYHCFIEAACRVTGIVNEARPFLCVNLKRTVLFDFNNDTPHAFYEWASNCLYQPVAEGAVVFRKPGAYTFFTIHFSLNEMAAHLKTHAAGHAFMQSVHKNEPAVLCRHNFPAMKTMRNAIAELLYCDATSNYYATWMEIKMRELLLLFIAGSGAGTYHHHAVSEQEAEAIYKVKDKLLSELHCMPLQEALAAYASLSEYKLKHGFRQIYGLSWIDFLHEARMKKAYDLVGYTRLPYYEIADRVGYQSLPTFMTKFRENVGLSPKRCRDGMQG